MNGPQVQMVMDVDWDDANFRGRLRAMLPFSFCDDAGLENPLEAPQMPARVLSSVRNCNLIDYARCASTEDFHDQVAEMTVKDNNNFWSSTGSPHSIGEEFLVYKLKHPMCTVRAVQIQVYRAAFQGGGPIYPAKRVLIEVGHSLSTMRTVGGPYVMACSDAMQTFMLPPDIGSSAVGCYVGIRFQGKYQKQHDDGFFYLSMRHVRVIGSSCAPEELLPLRMLRAHPSPPADVLAPTCPPHALSASLDTLLSGPVSSTRALQPLSAGDSCTSTVDVPRWAFTEALRPAVVASGDGRGRARKVRRGGLWRSEGGEGAPASATLANVESPLDTADSTADRDRGAVSLKDLLGGFDRGMLPLRQSRTALSRHRIDDLAIELPWTCLGKKRGNAFSGESGSNAAASSLCQGLSRLQAGMPAGEGPWRRNGVGMPLPPCEQTSVVVAPGHQRQEAEFTLPPIEPLRTTNKRAGCQWLWLNASDEQSGPLRHSTDSQGFFRCLVLERTSSPAQAQEALPVANERSRGDEPPLLLCNRAPDTITGSIRFVGARRSLKTTVAEPQKAASPSQDVKRAQSKAEMHHMLFGPVQSAQYATPME